MKISELLLTTPVKVPESPPKNTFVSYTPEWFKLEKERKEWSDKYDKEGYLVIYRERLSLSASFVNFDGVNADMSIFVKTLKEVADIFQKYESLNLPINFVYLKLSDFEKIMFGDNSVENNNNQYDEKLKQSIAKLEMFKDIILEYNKNQFNKLIIDLKNE